MAKNSLSPQIRDPPVENQMGPMSHWMKRDDSICICNGKREKEKWRKRKCYGGEEPEEEEKVILVNINGVSIDVLSIELEYLQFSRQAKNGS